MQDNERRAMLDAVPMPVLLVGPDERIEAANAAALARFGAELVGRPFVIVLRQPALGEALRRALAGGTVERLRVATEADLAVWMVQAAPLPGGRALVAFEDISALEQAEAARRDFVANVSHELRTPLTALIGFIETLRGAARDDALARIRFLEIMAREAARMNRLVGDLLSLSRVETEERQRPSAQVDLVALAAAAVAALRPQAEAAGVVLLLEPAAPKMPTTADADQISQVLNNLLENAVKYGAGGGEVRLRLYPVAHEPVLRGPAICIEVADRGAGIEAHHLPRLTERFYRVDSHRSREQGGTGLGLAIVKHIVARHRGRLKVESTPGQGSRFAVLLPQR